MKYSYPYSYSYHHPPLRAVFTSTVLAIIAAIIWLRWGEPAPVPVPAASPEPGLILDPEPLPEGDPLVYRPQAITF